MKSYPMAHLTDTSIPEFAAALKKAYRDNTWDLLINPGKSLGAKVKGGAFNPEKFSTEQELIDYLKLIFTANGNSYEAFLSKNPLTAEEGTHCQIFSCREAKTLLNLLDVETKALNNKIDVS
jgi:hypothetical protein